MSISWTYLSNQIFNIRFRWTLASGMSSYIST